MTIGSDMTNWCMANPDYWREARAAFTLIVKEENFYAASKVSLAQHWNGPQSGFSDRQVQARYEAFLQGWVVGKMTGDDK